jgi:acyl-CoA thioester hydrolase
MDDRFAFTVELPLRLRDLDAMNHVNNAVYATFLEQARAAYFHAVVGRRLNEVGMAIADLSIQFERPVHFDDDAVTVGVRAADLGTSSIPLEYEIWTGEERAATEATPDDLSEPGSGSDGPERHATGEPTEGGSESGSGSERGERHATAATTMVHVDRETGRATALPDEWREAIAGYEGLD